MKKLLTNGTVLTRDAAQPMVEQGAVLFEDGVILEVGTAAALEQAHPDAERIDAKGGIILPGFINAMVEQGAVLFEDGVILEVGTAAALEQAHPDAERIDAKGGIILPGFINAHHHIYSAFARGLSIPGNCATDFPGVLEGTWWNIDRHLMRPMTRMSAYMTLIEGIRSGVTTIFDHHASFGPGVLEGTWWNIDRHLMRPMTRMSAYMTLIEGIRSGVTTIFDHHASFGEIEGSLDEIAEAATTLGVRACLCYEISDRDGAEKARQSVLENERFENYCKTDKSGLLAAMCGMHASFTISEEISDRDGAEKARQSVLENERFENYCKTDKSGLLAAMCGMHASFTISEETMAFAREHTNAGFHIHVCEGAYDRDHCSATYHETVVHRLARHGILGEQTICGHCVYLTDEDRRMLAETGTAVVHNPQSNMGNAVGVTDILKLIGAGVTVGLGTDGFTSDILESVKTANVLVKHMNQHPSIGFGEVMDMAFVNNAKLADRHFGDTCGVIRPGARADLIVSDYRPMTRLGPDNINGHITFGMNGHNVTTTICGGIRPRPLQRDLSRDRCTPSGTSRHSGRADHLRSLRLPDRRRPPHAGRDRYGSCTQSPVQHGQRGWRHRYPQAHRRRRDRWPWH